MPEFAVTPPLAIVTGGSSGIGRAVAVELRRRGYRLLLIARELERLRDAAGEGDEVLSLDLVDTSNIAASVEPMLERLGPVSVLCNIAGAGLYKPFLEHTAEEHERLWRLNHMAAVELTRLVLPAMLAARRGHVINVTSMSALHGPWGHAGYASAKAAATNLTQTLACEHPAWTGVRFTAVLPGIVDTPFFDTAEGRALWERVRHRAIPPERVARAVGKLLHKNVPMRSVPRHYRVLTLIHAVSPRLAGAMVRRGSRPRSRSRT